MVARDDTTKERTDSIRGDNTPHPGVLLSVVAGKPAYLVTRYVDKPIVVGRGEGSTIVIDDERASRKHTELRREDNVWVVTDLGSRNRTSVDGVKLDSGGSVRGGQVVVVGDSIVQLEDDI